VPVIWGSLTLLMKMSPLRRTYTPAEDINPDMYNQVG
jgi:hypothetical protein